MKTHLLNQYRVENGIFARVLKNIFTFSFILIGFCGWSQTLTALSVSSASGTRTYGTAGTITYTVTATRSNSGNGSATFSISSLPSGVTAGFSPVTFSYSGSNKTATTTLTLTTTALATAVTNSSFTVTATANNSVNNTGTFTINKATPTVSVSPTATSIIYGQTLASSILSGGTSNVPGSFAFTTPSTAPNAGTTSQGVTFTPTNTANYNTTTTTASVTVIKSTPTVSVAPTASSITYGQTLTSSILSGGTSSVPGSYAFTTPSTAPNAGTISQGVTFTPTDITNYNITTTNASVTVIKATPTVTLVVSNSPTTYSGSVQSATVSIATSSVSGTVSSIFTGGAASQTTAGTYTVTASFVPTDIANYNSLTGLVVGNFIIDKATPTATLSVTNSPSIYSGSAQSATVSIAASSISGSVSSILTGGAATQTTAAAYAVTATFVPTDNVNYNSLLGLSAGNFVIDKATPTATLSVSNSPSIYSGSAQSATVGILSSSVSGAVSAILAGGLPSQITTGIYAVTASFVPTDSVNYNTLAGLSAGNFVIDKATPTATLSVSNTPSEYTGSAQSATVVIAVSSVSGTVIDVLVGGIATQSTIGTYSVTASFVPTDSVNYNTLTVLSAGNFVIIPAALSITANNASKCFGETYDLGTSAFTSSGLISPDTIGSVSFTSSGSGSGASSGSYTIVPSAATGGTFLATNYSITYNDGVLTVNPTNTAGVASSTPTICVNTALTDITHSTTGATGIDTVTGLPPGIIASWASDTITISGTPTLSGTFVYFIPLSGGCGSVNATGTIIVGDFTAPLLVGVPSDITVSCDAIPVAATPTATDNCDANPVISLDETSSQTISGVSHYNYTIVRVWTVTDADNNVSSETQVVNVIDITAPIADVLSLEAVTGECSATITTVPTATDNCNGTIVGTTTDLLTRDIQGTSTVTWIFTDAVGNTSTQTQDIVVTDTTAPVADALSLTAATGLCFATILSPPTATDNCNGTIVGTTTDLLTSDIQGTTTVTWTFTDAVGNTSIQTQDLIVTDIPDTVATLTVSDIYLCKYIGTTNPVTFTAASGASSYIWTVPADVTIISGQGTESLVVDFHSSTAIGNTIMGYVGVKAVNASGCVSTIPKAYGLVPRYPKAPSTLALTYNGVAKYRVGNFIGDASKTLVLTATDNSGSATSYYWDLPAGITVVSGDPNNDKVISIHFGNVIPGTTDLVFSVYSLAGCGASIAQTLTIKRDLPSVPTALSLTDDAISSIVKITNVSAYTGKLKTTTLTLTATPATVPGYESTSYKWILPSGIAIVAASANFVSEASGFKTYTSTSNVISINLSGIGTATSLLLKVYGVNGNGESLLSRNLTLKSTIPAKPGALTTLSGAVATYHPSCNTITVKVPNVLGVSYLWSITGGALATIVSYNSDGNEATIDVSQLSSAPLSSFTINVTASNGTGTSIASIYNIKLGTSCSSGSRIMSQKTISKKSVSDEFNVIAYPNPSSGVFNIKIQSSDTGETEVKVLDMTGRIIEVFKAQSNSVELGARYPSGIYKVIINQGGKYKILQIIKD